MVYGFSIALLLEFSPPSWLDVGNCGGRLQVFSLLVLSCFSFVIVAEHKKMFYSLFWMIFFALIGLGIVGLIALFLLVCFYTTFRKLINLRRISKDLTPDAKISFDFWVTAGDKAYALGRDRDARMFRARAMVVLIANYPIMFETCSDAPLICQPGQIDTLPDDQIQELNEQYDDLCSGKHESLRSM